MFKLENRTRTRTRK